MASEFVQFSLKIPPFRRLKLMFSNKLTLASKDVVNHLENWIETNTGNGGIHYTEQTGNLKRATKVEGNLKKKIKMYVDEGMVAYGSWILSGKRNDPRHGIVTWGSGDPFIDEAWTANEQWIFDTVDSYIQDAVIEFENSPLEEL